MLSGGHSISCLLAAIIVSLAIGCIHLSSGANHRLQNSQQSSGNRPQIDQYLHARRKRDTSSGTTQNLEYIFRGRCYQYVQVINKLNVNCDQLWRLFKTAVTSGPYCGVHNYTEFVDAALQYLENSDKQFVFWSKTKRFTAQYTYNGLRKYSLSDTLIGYLVDDLKFCGANGQFNFTSCPKLSDCELVDDPFWSEASLQFARRAQPQNGGVLVILNGSISSFPATKAYRNDSFFFKYELPNIGKNYNIAPSQITINVLLVQNFGFIKERCDTESLIELENDAKKYGYQYRCINNPTQLRHLLCVDEYNRPECAFLNVGKKIRADSFYFVGIVIFALVI